MGLSVGEGQFRFEAVPDWPQVPKGWTLGQVGIASDSQDRVYLFNRSEHPMMVFDRDGNFVESWGEGVFTSAHFLSIDHLDHLYLPIFRSHVIVKCDTKGRQLMTLGTWNEPSNAKYKVEQQVQNRLIREQVTEVAGPFTLPTDVTVLPDGTLFVSDGYGNARIHQFTSEGVLVDSWGEPGKGPGQFNVPHSVKVLSDGRLVIADRENNRLQLFDMRGRFLEEWTGFNTPCGIFVDKDDTIFVAEGAGWNKQGRPEAFVSIYSPNGKRITGWKPPHGAGAHAIGMDSAGDLYVGQNREGGRVLKYRRC